VARRLVLAALLALAIEGCRQCTLILCRETLTLTVRTSDGGAPERLRGEISVEGETLSFSCPDPLAPDHECTDAGIVTIDLNFLGQDGRAFVGDPLPAQLPLTLEVPDAGQAWSGTVTPAYTRFEPNGPGCGDCGRGTATVTLEAR